MAYTLSPGLPSRTAQPNRNILIASGTPVFFNYQENVYQPNWGTADCLEEALATAKEIKSIPDSGVKKFMANLALHSPGGYRHYKTCMPPRFIEYQDLLYSQVAEGSLGARPRPHRAPKDRGLFSTANVPVYLVVPVKDEKTDDALVVFEKQQPQVKTHQLLKYAERIGGYVGESGGPTRLNIFSQPPNSSLERAIPELNRLGLEHFGFHVDDLESEMARFEAEGIRVILPLTVTPQGIKLAYIEGPDDVVIELVQAAP